MSEEQRIILDMLSQGKITVEEAQKLLENLSQEEAPQPEQQRARREEPRSIVESIVDTLRSGFSGFNFGFSEGKIVLEEQHTGRFGGNKVELDLDVRNGSIRVSPSEDQYFRLEIIKRVSAGTRERAEEMLSGYKFAEYHSQRLQAGDRECRNLGGRVSVSLRLWLPRGHVYSGRILSKNGTLEVNALDIDDLYLNTVNGALRVGKVNGGRLSGGTVNGSISIEGSLAEVEIKTTNGSINLLGMAEDSKISVKTVNGRISVQLPAREDIGYSVDARATSGRVQLEHDQLKSGFSSERVGAGRRIEGATDNWGRSSHRIGLYLRSVNGSISISELE